MLAQIDWWQKVYAYSERGNDPSFWAEPFNAWSNTAFWVAAACFAVWLVVVPGRVEAGTASPSLKRGAAWRLWLLNILLIGIGVGSFCFHTFAVRWAGLLDVGFIVLWVYWYLWLSARFVLRWDPLVTLAVLSAHLLAAVVLLASTGWFLMSYVPTALAAYALALHASRFPLPGRDWLWGSAVVFTISMVFAGLDHSAIGKSIPTGTHFLWHLCNAAALLLGSIGLALNMRVGPPPIRPAPAAA